MRQRRPRPEGANTASRLRFIEGMRGLAALYVVFGHFCSMADPRAFQHEHSHAPLWLQNVMAPFWYGHLAVAAFIAISGYCLQMSLFQSGNGTVDSLRRFFTRRARRILPPYYACLVLSVIVAILVTSKQPGMPFEQYVPVTAANVWAHILLVHNLSPAWMYKINGVLWSIAAEVQLYLLFPLIVWLVSRYGRNLTMLVSGLAAYAILAEFPGAMKLYVWYIALFALGITAAHAAYRPVVSIGVRPRTAYIAGFVSFAICLFGIASDWDIPITDTFVALACCCVMYAGSAAPESLLPRTLGSKPLAALGAISYSLYLMHHPIQQILYVIRPAWAEGESGVFLYMLVLGLPAILLGTAAFWYFFERPFVRRLSATSKRNPMILPNRPLVALVEDRRVNQPAVSG